jgi:aminopeptidase-like protein
MWALAHKLYPVCRSITGDGVRWTLREIARQLPLDIREVPSGTAVLDWTVPDEWNIRAAHITDSRGRRIVDFADHSLHVVSYSVPVSRRMTLAELRPHLHSLPDQPDLIPYKTSYYRPTWGFCLPHRVVEGLLEDTYEVVVDSTLAPGSLTYGEALIRGETDEEVLLSAHVCHPSLANDNCSGLALLAWLGRHLGRSRRRYSYRLLFAPGTIGSIAWLAANPEKVGRIRHAMTLSNVGDGGGPTYKRSRRGNADIDRAAALVLAGAGPEARIEDFSPYGYDERQYCSPGFDIPAGAFQRSRWGTFPEYHTSADDMTLVRPEHLERSLHLVCRMLDVVEGDQVLRSTMPYGEPQLGRRGLYDGPDGRPLPEPVRMALLWVMSLAGGRHSLIAMAERSRLPFHMLRSAADGLLAKGLLVADNGPGADCRAEVVRAGRRWVRRAKARRGPGPRSGRPARAK